MKDTSTVLALMVGGIIISTYEYQYVLQDDNTLRYAPITNEMPNLLMRILGCTQAVTSFMLVIGFLVNSASLIVKAGWRERVSTNEIEMIVEKREL